MSCCDNHSCHDIVVKVTFDAAGIDFWVFNTLHVLLIVCILTEGHRRITPQGEKTELSLSGTLRDSDLAQYII